MHRVSGVGVTSQQAGTLQSQINLYNTLECKDPVRGGQSELHDFAIASDREANSALIFAQQIYSRLAAARFKGSPRT